MGELEPRRAGSEALVQVQKWDTVREWLLPFWAFVLPRPSVGEMGATPFREGWLTSIQMFILSQNTLQGTSRMMFNLMYGNLSLTPTLMAWPCPHMQLTIKTRMVVLFLPGSPWANIPVWFLQRMLNNPSTLTPFYVLRLGAHWVSRTFLPSPPKPRVLSLQMTKRCSLALHREFQQQLLLLSWGFCHRYDSSSPFSGHLQTTPSTFI